MSGTRESRILIVDDQRDVARVLRASLELLKRGYFIVDVPSGEEAMLELQSKSFDLIVADYRLPGMSGAEFLKRARKRTPGIKAIMITGHSVAEVKKELGDIEVSDIFSKPLDTEAFTGAVERALSGAEKAREPGVTPAEEKLPEFNEDAVSRTLASLVTGLGANAVAFVNREGKVVLRQGQIDEDLRFSELAILLAYNFTTTAEIATYLGEGTSGAVHYYDGKRHDIYALAVGTDFFIAIVFPGGSQKQMGPVLRFGREAAQKIVDQIAGEAPAKAPARASDVKPEEEALLRAKTGPLAAEVVEALARAEAEQEEEAGPMLDIDLDDLDAALEDVGDVDSFWEKVAAEAETEAADEDARTPDDVPRFSLFRDAEEE
jgi:CheY-like chemotaxis protein